ncbi:hypothetical protein ACQ4PT_044089 [Festuca glaucescens]
MAFEQRTGVAPVGGGRRVAAELDQVGTAARSATGGVRRRAAGGASRRGWARSGPRVPSLGPVEPARGGVLPGCFAARRRRLRGAQHRRVELSRWRKEAAEQGKSYLLNQLFGANFPVMDKKQGWQQTTKGILMSRTVGPSLLILDVEGFDGKERGEDRKFENQAALFALTYRTS